MPSPRKRGFGDWEGVDIRQSGAHVYSCRSSAPTARWAAIQSGPDFNVSRANAITVTTRKAGCSRKPPRKTIVHSGYTDKGDSH